MKPRQNILFTKINLSDYRADQPSLQYQSGNRIVNCRNEGNSMVNNRKSQNQQTSKIRMNRNTINFECDFHIKQEAQSYKPKLAFGLIDQGSQGQNQNNQQDRQSSFQNENQSDDQSLDRQYQLLAKTKSTKNLQIYYDDLLQDNKSKFVSKGHNKINLRQQTYQIKQHKRQDKQTSHILIQNQQRKQDVQKQYQTLSLEQHSLIDSENERLKQQLQKQCEINKLIESQIKKLKRNERQMISERQQLSLNLNHAEKFIKQLQSKATSLAHLLEKKEKSEQYNQKQREKLIKQIKRLQLLKNRSYVNEKTYLTERCHSRSINKISNNQKYIEKQNSNPNQNKYNSVCSQKDTESLMFETITIYLKQRSRQLIDDICKSKIPIHEKVYSMLEDFIQQLIQINPKTVERVVSKYIKSNPNLSASVIYNTSKTETEMESLSNCQALTPVSNRFQDFRNQRAQDHQQMKYNNQIRSNRFASVSNAHNRLNQQYQNFGGRCDRTSQLFKLEKSIDKLKNMEKSLMSASDLSQCKINNQRSIIGHELENSAMGDRSKSRRKKIFS